jgi:hypothetical protein
MLSLGNLVPIVYDEATAYTAGSSGAQLCERCVRRPLDPPRLIRVTASRAIAAAWLQTFRQGRTGLFCRHHISAAAKCATRTALTPRRELRPRLEEGPGIDRSMVDQAFC